MFRKISLENIEATSGFYLEYKPRDDGELQRPGEAQNRAPSPSHREMSPRGSRMSFETIPGVFLYQSLIFSVLPYC